MTVPIRTTAIPIGEAVLFGELPGRYSLAGAAEDGRVGGESCCPARSIYCRPLAASSGHSRATRHATILTGGPMLALAFS
ncbi:MAG: hypothetical protein JOZ19_06855 [Rubrobacter sp.]|nr:hypothetical protein [Rubrobacter sp.]